MRWVASVVLVMMSAGAFASACAPAPIGDYPETNDTKLPTRKGGDAGASEDDGVGGGNDAAATAPSKPTLTVTLKGAGTVTSTPNGVTCTGTTCTGTFATGTKVTLVPKPEAGSLFAGWTGGCTGSAVCEPTLTANVNVTADFQTLDGTWTGTYTQSRTAQNCNFTNAGNWSTTLAAGAGGALTSSATNGTGFELRQIPGCGLVATKNGSAGNTSITATGGTLTGSWAMSIQNASGTLDMPFTATVVGTKMTGTWTCATCTGSFTLNKQ